MFDVEDESWSRLAASWPEACQPYNLWDCDGHLFMVGERSGVLTIWKLIEQELAWSEVAMISPKVADVADFCGEKDVAGHGTFLCIMLVWARKGILYDLRTGTWSWLPYCPIRAFNWGNVIPYTAAFCTIDQDKCLAP